MRSSTVAHPRLDVFFADSRISSIGQIYRRARPSRHRRRRKAAWARPGGSPTFPLCLTGGVILSGGLIATAPRIAATGLLGEDAAVTVSVEKLLARRERRVRENIDTRYLRIESLERINVGKGTKSRISDWWVP